MPRAGWCRECGEWVWVDEEGACQNGHGPECVGGIYDATPQELGVAGPQRDFGSGEMPPELNRFNWAAMLLPSIWGIAYGAWPVVSLWLITFITPFVLVTIVGFGGTDAVATWAVGITVISQLVGAIISLYIGMNATAILWRKEHARLEIIEGSVPRFSIERYLTRQRLWIAFGVGITLMSVAGLAIIGLASGEVADQVREQMGVSRIDAAGAFVWLAAEVLLGLWLSYKMRKEPS